jgi:hypothetical protein
LNPQTDTNSSGLCWQEAVDSVSDLPDNPAAECQLGYDDEYVLDLDLYRTERSQGLRPPLPCYQTAQHDDGYARYVNDTNECYLFSENKWVVFATTNAPVDKSYVDSLVSSGPAEWDVVEEAFQAGESLEHRSHELTRLLMGDDYDMTLRARSPRGYNSRRRSSKLLDE